MKHFGVAVGLAGFLAIGSANAGPSTVIYDSIGNSASPTDGFAYGPSTTPSTPSGDSFAVSAPTQLKTVTMRLFDATEATDAGSVLVYLVPMDPARNAPNTGGTTNSTVLVGATLLQTIPDNKLPTSLTGGCALVTSCDTSFSTSAFVGPGTYWIVAVDSSTSGAEWEANFRNGGGAGSLTGGVGISGEYVTWKTGAGGFAANNLQTGVGAEELTITTPEPASLALLGVGLVGLGLRRRRRAKIAAE